MGALRAESVGRTPNPSPQPEHIRVPEDLDLPDGLMELIKKKLTPQGAQVFSQQIVDALHRSIEERDLIPVHNVIEAWHRTLLFVERERFTEDNWEKSNSDDPILSLEDVRKRLDLG